MQHQIASSHSNGSIELLPQTKQADAALAAAKTEQEKYKAALLEVQQQRARDAADKATTMAARQAELEAELAAELDEELGHIFAGL
eukprot:SAG31_NODE_878_length_11297_cov_3.770714_5_plen_86_part_00